MIACAPPNENCAPPSEDCAPKKLTGSRLLECKLVFATVSFVLFVDWHRISWHFWDEDLLFFWRSLAFGRKNRLNSRFWPENSIEFQWRPFFYFLEIICFRPEKPLEFAIRNLTGEIPLNFSEDLFVFGDHLFSAGKTAWIRDFGWKIPLNLWSSPCSFHPDWYKFLMPPCPSRIHTNKLLVPPQNLFLPPQSRCPGAGPGVKVSPCVVDK